MQLSEKPPTLLIVDDDDEDIYLTKRAFCAEQPNLVFRSVQSGDELFDYLSNAASSRSDTDIPDVILLDINIPKENGFSILQRLKASEEYSHIPVSMFTTSSAPQDIKKAYQLGASSFICKSVNANGMKELVTHFCGYWFKLTKFANT